MFGVRSVCLFCSVCLLIGKHTIPEVPGEWGYKATRVFKKYVIYLTCTCTVCDHMYYGHIDFKLQQRISLFNLHHTTVGTQRSHKLTHFSFISHVNMAISKLTQWFLKFLTISWIWTSIAQLKCHWKEPLKLPVLECSHTPPCDECCELSQSTCLHLTDVKDTPFFTYTCTTCAICYFPELWFSPSFEIQRVHYHPELNWCNILTTTLERVKLFLFQRGEVNANVVYYSETCVCPSPLGQDQVTAIERWLSRFT